MIERTSAAMGTITMTTGTMRVATVEGVAATRATAMAEETTIMATEVTAMKVVALTAVIDTHSTSMNFLTLTTKEKTNTNGSGVRPTFFDNYLQ